MLKIGEFAKMCGASVQTLRYAEDFLALVEKE